MTELASARECLTPGYYAVIAVQCEGGTGTGNRNVATSLASKIAAEILRKCFGAIIELILFTSCN